MKPYKVYTSTPWTMKKFVESFDTFQEAFNKSLEVDMFVNYIPRVEYEGKSFYTDGSGSGFKVKNSFSLLSDSQLREVDSKSKGTMLEGCNTRIKIKKQMKLRFKDEQTK